MEAQRRFDVELVIREVTPKGELIAESVEQLSVRLDPATEQANILVEVERRRDERIRPRVTQRRSVEQGGR